jgi:hypothetical protein
MTRPTSQPDLLDRLARGLSRIVHPFIVPGPTLWYATWRTTGDPLRAALWTLAFLALVIVPTALLILYRHHRGIYGDLDVSHRPQRPGVYLASGVLLIGALAAFALVGAPRILVVSFLAAFVALAGVLLATFKTKVSAHAGVSAGCSLVLFWVSPPAGLVATLAALAVSWARVRLRSHTVPQVVLGWVIALAATAMVFAVLRP